MFNCTQNWGWLWDGVELINELEEEVKERGWERERWEGEWERHQVVFTGSLYYCVQPVAAGCIIFWGRSCAADVMPSITNTLVLHLKKDDRLNQLHVVLIQWQTGAQTQDQKILSQPP